MGLLAMIVKVELQELIILESACRIKIMVGVMSLSEFISVYVSKYIIDIKFQFYVSLLPSQRHVPIGKNIQVSALPPPRGLINTRKHVFFKFTHLGLFYFSINSKLMFLRVL